MSLSNPLSPPASTSPAAVSPPTLRVGERRELRIEDVAFGGEGIARIGGFVVFVPFVIAGETVEAEITEVKRSFARARLLRVTSCSPARVSAPCRYFGDCGGCQYQHINYPAQLGIKRKQVADILQRIGGFNPALVDAVVPCPVPYGYRNRIMIRSQWDKFKQGLNIGFIRHDNRLVLDIDQCLIAEPALNEGIRQVRRNPPPKGGLKIVLRTPPGKWHVPRDSFFQNNLHLLDRLAATVRERVREAQTPNLIDLYCGVGFFSLELASQVTWFAGVEVDAAAIKAARRNAADRAITNGEFLLGRTEDLLPELLGRFHPDRTTLIVDPPRRGCARVTMDLLTRRPTARLLYVSCHPATLSRDLRALCSTGGYSLARVTPLDMFPQTQHVECVAELHASNAA